MSTSLRPICPGTHPAFVGEVERRSLVSELRQCLLGVSSKDPKIQQLRKDVQRGQNKAPETIASMVTDAFNSGNPAPERLASTIRDFFSAHTHRLQRKLRELSPIETREEGELNCIQVSIDQGDTSTPTLTSFIAEIDENVAVLLEMRSAAVAERYRSERSQ